MTGPDAAGFYTLTLTGVVLNNADLLTGGIGYAYDLPSNQPLTQTNLGAPYATTDVSIKTGTVLGVACGDPAATPPGVPCIVKSGGLIVPVQNKWKTAAGFTARRPIVNNAKCLNCHAFLGVEPSFHVGQRNDGPTCSFCHTPNRTSSGWSAGSPSMIHSMHYSLKRSVPYNWHAACPTGNDFVPSATPGTYGKYGDCRVGGVATGAVVAPDPYFGDIEYPGSSCSQCHEAGAVDFSAPASAAALPNLLWTTVATGSFTASISNSPYVALGTAYGSGFSHATATGVSTPAAGTTLVNSPISSACFSCHDTEDSKHHMEINGGRIYQPRGTPFVRYQEACLDCHGAGKTWAVDAVH
jgi:OmcA/MtrC family decaheme c-type cytochrome